MMTRQDFIKQIEKLYTGDADFDLYNGIDESEEIIIPSVDVKITFGTEDTFNIYRDFCYPTRDCEENFENEYRSALESITTEILRHRFDEKPLVEEECSYGCPFDTTLLGYWGKSFDIGFVESFVTICREAELTDIGNIASTMIMESVSQVAHKFNFRKRNGDDDVLLDKSNRTIIFAKDISRLKFTELNTKKIEPVDFPVSATRYFCGKTKSGQIVVVDIKAILNFFKLCDHFHVDKADFDFFCINGEFLYVKGNLKALILIEKDAEDMIDEEYSLFVRKLDALRRIKPTVSRASLDFSHLSFAEFEKLCYDYLIEKGFRDVHPVGKATVADGGKDIIAYEEYKTLTGTERRKWIWQCKHSKKSLNRKDVSEISDLLAENKATAYGLFCSNSLTPDLINRLELKNDGQIKIIYYGASELTTVLWQYTSLLSKYKLIGGDTE